MCWRIVTHTLNCDVRPIIYDEMNKTKLVDPFANPVRCNCPDHHLDRFQCKYHGCCLATEELDLCHQDHCPKIFFTLHRYAQRPPQANYNIWGPNHPLFYLNPYEPRPDWEVIQDLDKALFPEQGIPQLTACSQEFIDMLSRVVEIGRCLGAKQAEFHLHCREIQCHEQMHASFHATVCVPRNMHCPAWAAINQLKTEAEKLRTMIEFLSAAFRRDWTGLSAKAVHHIVMAQVNEFLKQQYGAGMLKVG
ncbi:hypothetical protein ACHAPT_001101 [Fusarium lateritium]